MKTAIKYLKRSKEDRGAANTVSFIVIMLFVMILIVSFIDVGVYFNAKNELRSAAENGARNVAMYGGTDASSSSLRGKRTDVNDPIDVVWNSIATNYKPNGASSTPVVEINRSDITCGPTREEAGNEVWCEIDYKYNGLAGNFGLFTLGGGDGVKIKGVAVSEVTLQ